MRNITLPRQARSFAHVVLDPAAGLETPPRLIELLPVAIYACDKDGRILWCNRKAVELWGRSPRLRDDKERFCGFFKAYDDEGREISRERTRMADVLGTGATIEGFDCCLERPDGTRLWVTMHIDPVHDKDGNLIGAINCFHDTTAAHVADNTLRERQQDLEDFFENGTVALHLVGHDGTILRANRAELDLLGYRHAEYVGRNISEFHADPPVIGDILTRLCAGQKLDKYPARLRAKDGSIKHVLITSNVQFRNGQFINTRCFTIDVTHWKHAEQTLSENEQRLAATYEHAAIGISEVDLEGRRLRVNEAACRITGRTREEMVGAVVFDTLHPDDREDDLGQHRRLVAGEIDRYAIEKRYVRADGRAAWLAVLCSAVRDEAGRFLYAVRVFHDVTEAKRAINALAESEQRLAATYEHANVGIGEVDATGRILRVNRIAREITGRSREDLLQRTIFDSTQPEIQALDRGKFQDLIAGKIDRYTLEKRYVRGDGVELWMEVICSAVRDTNGNFLFGVRVFQDVTKSRLWAQALAESEQRLAATYEHAAIGISEVDADGRLLRVNEAVCSIIGYSAEELLRLTVFDVTHPDDRGSDRDNFSQLVGGKAGPYAVEKRLICKDGRVIWVSIASSSVYDPAGRFLYGIRVMQDITARKRTEEIIRESEQRLRQVLEALPTAVYTTDASGRVDFYNEAAVELSGRPPQLGTDEWCISWRLYDLDGRLIPHDQCPMAVALKENRPVRGQELVIERPDGSRASVIPYPTPLHDASGALVGAVNMLVDITERKNAEARQKALVDELNHRVKNTLATVQSLAAQTLRGSGIAGELRDDFTARLFALSRTHDQLSRGGWETADFKSVVDGIVAPFQRRAGRQVRLDGPSVRLPPNAALLLAMVLHELATNAAKYGALSLSAGSLDLHWGVANGDAGRRLTIEWREAGGPPVRKPERRGFGSRLAERAISQELKGKAQISFDPAGLHCKFEIPLLGPNA